MNELEDELRIFNRPTGLHVGGDWQMSYPESWVTEMSQTVAAYLLAHFDGVEVPIEVEFFLGHLRGSLADARDQMTMFEAQ